MEETHCKTSHGKGYKLKVDPTAIIVVISGLLINIIYSGMYFIGGLYLSLFMEEFGTGKTLTAWVLSLQGCITYFTGIITGPLIARHGTRPVAVGGALCSSMGILLSAFSPNIEYLYITFGFMSGVGFGLLMITNGVAVQQHTSRRRALAGGIALIGPGLGTVILPLITKWAITTYGWRGSFLFMSAIMLNTLPCALLLRPPPLSITRNDREDPRINHCLMEKRDVEIEPRQDTTGMISMQQNSRSDTMIQCSKLGPPIIEQQEVDTKQCSHPEMKCSCHSLKNFFTPAIENDEPLLTPVTLLCIASWFCFFAANGVIYIFMDVKAESMGFESSEGAILMSFTGIGDMSGRIIGTFVGTLHEKLPLVISITMPIASGICVAAVILCSTYMQMVLNCVVFGVAIGMNCSMLYTTLRDLVGLNLLPWLMSIGYIFGGFGNLLLIQFLAFAWEQTDSFVIPYLMGGSVLAISGCITMIAKLVKDLKSKTSMRST